MGLSASLIIPVVDSISRVTVFKAMINVIIVPYDLLKNGKILIVIAPGSKKIGHFFSCFCILFAVSKFVFTTIIYVFHLS